jgi:hypothetical protein
MAAIYANDSGINGKVRAFVQASKDLSMIAAQAEAEAAEACIRIGTDLGIPLNAMSPRNEAGGRAKGACEPVAAQIDVILRAGLRFTATVTPPQCQASAQAQAECSGACGAQGQDAECNASCHARSELLATCTPIRVLVQPSIANEQALRLAASLSANLPTLLHAQIVLGQRILKDVEVLVQVGSNLPGIVGEAGVRAGACIAAAASATVQASVSIKATVQVSANVSGRAGV